MELTIPVSVGHHSGRRSSREASAMRVLLVEDDRLMARSVELILDEAGLDHETAASGEAALEYARSYEFDVVLLDLTLPDISGHEVLRQLRQLRITTPVLILSGDAETGTKVTGFGAGADDYVTKPFDKAELLARIHALVRRSQGHAQSLIVTGPMSIDLAARTVSVDGRRVSLTGKEYAILEMLSLRKGMTLTKEMFLTHLYGGRDEPELKIIDVFVCKLRKKLHLAGAPASGCIETVWGRGYALRDPQAEHDKVA
ncbi:two-component system cell cycle response regulator CtrA [Polymorphobacter multimanifer]|uniref:Two-component system cell cycle response regulator CtrA n=2 Tax=Polymorphobacter multimanifer TaxID=1070431 RepID=A0A841L1P6_9SPHN|nr:two-component system cell cycle response regulator CtrA [Polymorphobacter multimanifer]